MTHRNRNAARRRFRMRPSHGEPLEPRTLLSAEPYISEFVADDSASLLDGYGHAEDWIEIHNPADTPVQLANYALTDDPTDLDRWVFPTRELQAGERLVVFASGRNEPDPAGNLHTNFRLEKSGEYVALVAPDHQRVLSQYTFGAQRQDVGFGVGQLATEQVILSGTTPATLHVVRMDGDEELARDWTNVSEPGGAANWLPVSAAVGFSPAGLPTDDNIARGATVTASGPLWPGFLASYLTDGKRTTFAHPATPVNEFSYVIDLGGEHALDRLQIVNRGDGCCPDRLSNYQVSLHDDDGGEVGPAVWSTVVRADGSNSGNAGVDTLVASLDPSGDFSGRYITISRVDDGTTNYWPQIAEVEAYVARGYSPWIQTDLAGVMQGISSAALMRVPFQVDAVHDNDQFQLQLQFDDGYVAYLNGQEVARRNAPDGPPAAGHFATAEHLGGTLETIVLPRSLLRTGANLFAIELLNRSVNDADLLLAPTIVKHTTSDTFVGYLPQTTPGQLNNLSVNDFLPPVNFDVPRGFFDSPVSLTLSAPVAGATLVYTLDGSTPTPTHGTQVLPSGDTWAQTTLTLTTTTTVRAIATRSGDADSIVTTQSYFFLRDVLTQPKQPAGLPTKWADTAADYEMDPDVVNDPAYQDEMVDALRSIPTLSIVTDPDNLWDADKGIYINSTQRGDNWERPTSIELILPDGSSGFQVDAGLRMWGTGWAPHSASKKHAFQLKFKPKYGPSKLDYPWFPDAPVSEFDDIVLRAQGSRSWNDFRQPDINQSQYTRDAWARDTAREMGKLEGHATFVHLYLNGLYWGLYNPVERTDEQFAEEYLGGDAADYDIINHRSGQPVTATSGNLDAWKAMMAIADGGLQSDEAYAAIQTYLDVDDFIDYMLIQQYATNHDGPDQGGNNLRALRRRTADGRFTFHVWDMEYTLWYPDENRNLNEDVADSPMHLLAKLRQNADFRQRYSELAHRHLTQGGALTPERSAARYEARADEIYQAILGESARWGDARRAKPYTRNAEWVTERDRLLHEYFPQRTAILIDQLRSAGLFYDIADPQFNTVGGAVPAGFAWSVTASAGEILYTLDGSDPRMPGGGVRPSAESLAPFTTLVGPSNAWQVSIPQDDSQRLTWASNDVNVSLDHGMSGQGVAGFDSRAVAAPLPVTLQNPTATFSQSNRPVSSVIDGDLAGKAWGLSQPVDFQGPVIRAATAVFETAVDTGFEDGTELTFTLIHNLTNRNNLGRFRLSVTTDDRDQFADGKDSAGDVTANWVVLHPTQATSSEGSTLTIDADGSLFVSGGLNQKDTYTIIASTPLDHITGIRLETLTDPLLPGRGGPGRGAGGAALLSEFLVAAAPARFSAELDPVVAAELAAAANHNRTSLYLRVPFNVASTDAFTGLRLRLRYTDGFVAYLNGQPVARSGVGGSDRLPFDSTAVATRPGAAAMHGEEYDISSVLPLLHAGVNMLAIHGLNAAASADALIVAPELIAQTTPLHAVYSSQQIVARVRNGNEWSDRVTLSLQPFGDFNADQRVDSLDLALICLAIQQHDAQFDLTGDQQTDFDDLNVLLHDGLHSRVGDVNFDGHFDSDDLVLVFQRGAYETAAANPADWADGDWNCDGRFTSEDLVAAFQDGGYDV